MINKIKNFFKRTNKYFLVSFILIFISIIIKYPSASIFAEIWAEMGTSFLHDALHKTAIENIWADTLYLQWSLRTISVLVVKLGMVKYFPLAVQLISITLISFFASMLNLNVFRKIIFSDKIRFMLSLSLGLVADYQLYAICFAYFGIIFCGLMFFVDKEKIKTSYFWGALILNFLLITSKAQFIVLLPLVLFFLAYSLIKNKKKSFIFYSASLVAIFFQISTVLSPRMAWKIEGPPTTIFSLIKAGITSSIGLLNSYVGHILGFEPVRLYLKYNLKYTDFKNILQIENLGVYATIFIIGITLLFTLVVVAYALVKLYQKSEKKTLIIFVLCNIMAFGCLLLFTLSWFPGSQSLHLITVGKNRAHYFVAALIYFGLVTLLAKGFEIKAFTSKLIKILAIIVLALMFLEPVVSFYTPSIGSDPYTVDSYSQWQSYRRLLTYEDYCIPINPYPWIMSKNCYQIKPKVNFTSETKVKKLNLDSEHFENPDKIFLRAVIIENDNVTSLNKPSIVALDKNNRELGRARLLTNRDGQYWYFLFEEKVSPHALALIDNNQLIPFHPKIKLFGTIKP